MASMDVEPALRESIVRICGIPEERVAPEATLDDLGIDSLASAEIIVELRDPARPRAAVDVLRRLEQVRHGRRRRRQLRGGARRAGRTAAGDDRRRRASGGRHARRRPSPTTTTSRTSSSRSGSGDDLVYSCALWDADRPGRHASARRSSASSTSSPSELGVRGGAVLDIGCGWGALLDRFVARARRGRRRRSHAEPGAGRLARRPRACPASTSGSRAGSTTSPDAPLRRHHLHRGDRAPRLGRARRRREGRGLPRVLRALRATWLRDGGRLGPAAHLPRQRRPRGQPRRARAAVGADPRRDLPRVDARRRSPSWCSAGRRTSSSSGSSTTTTTTGGRSGPGAWRYRAAGGARAARSSATRHGPDLRALLRRRRGALPAARALAVPRRS